jgi:hypothetical protein
MKRVFLMISLIFLIVPLAHAQKTRTKQHPLRKPYYQVNTSYHLWQETIDATTGPTSGEVLTQFHGFRVGASYNKPRKSVRWVESYSLDLGLGIAKGKATAPLIDEIKDQPWFSVAFTPGMVYRTTSKSELAFVLPVTYRMVQWDLQEPFELSDKAFSVGLGGVYIQRFNLKSSLAISVVHQHMWNATVWSIGWQHAIR